MAAGITASLSGAGVLMVTGTDNADQINFRQTNGAISIVGVDGSFSATRVTSIIVDLKGGDDTVSLNSSANGGNQTLAEEVTVKSGAGIDKVKLVGGSTVGFQRRGAFAGSECRRGG